MFTTTELGLALILLTMWIGWEVGNDSIDADVEEKKGRRVRELRGGQHSLPDQILLKEKILKDRGAPLPTPSGDPNEFEADLDLALKRTSEWSIENRGMSNDGFLERGAEPGSSRDTAGLLKELVYLNHMRSTSLREPPHRNDNL